MKNIVDYLKKLFLMKEKPLDKSEYITVLGLLWFCNYTIILHMIGKFINQYLSSRIISVETIGILATINLTMNVVFPIFLYDIPWMFILFVGSLLLARRLYTGNLHPALQILTGISIFTFFRGMIAIPAFPVLSPDFFYHSTETMKQMKPAMDMLFALRIPFFIGGLTALVIPFFRLKKNPVKEEEKKNKHYTREIFTLRYTVLSLVFAFLSIMFSYIIRFIFKDKIDDPVVRVCSIIICLTGLIIMIVFIIRRISDSGYSILIILILPAALVLTVAGVLTMVYLRHILIIRWAIELIAISFEIPSFFILWLLLVPSKNRGEQTLPESS